MIILIALSAWAAPTRASFYPKVTFIEERGGPERLPALQNLVDETDQGKCSLFFEFLPRRVNADAATKIKTMKQLCSSKTKFGHVFGMESEALKILDAVAGLYIGLRHQEYRDIGSQVALAYGIGEISFRSALKRELSLQPWRKLLDLGHPTTVFQQLGAMPLDDLRQFLKAFYKVLLKHVRMDKAAFYEIDLDEFQKSEVSAADVHAYFDRAIALRNAYMAESIVTCEKALKRPIKVAVHPDHIEKLLVEFRKVWSGLDVDIVKDKEAKTFTP